MGKRLDLETFEVNGVECRLRACLLECLVGIQFLVSHL